MNYMQKRCGAWQLGGDSDGGEIEFGLYFPSGPDPRITGIRVTGTFQSQLGGIDWDVANGLPLAPSSDTQGTFWTARTGQPLLPAGFYEYKYHVTFCKADPRFVSDPCTRYGGRENQNAAVVVGGSRPEENQVRPLEGGRKPLRDLNVYEVMIDDFTAAFRGKRAPLAAVEDKLDYLTDLGFNAILFMPWTAGKDHNFDWGYEPFQYFSVERRYTEDIDHKEEGLSWLKRLVSACHDRGIHVIMDGVFNHVSTAFPYLAMYENPADCPYVGKFGGEFAGLSDLQFEHECTRDLIFSVCQYWIDGFGIDGIRFDNTTNYYDPGKEGTKGLPELLAHIDDVMQARREHNFSLTIEHIDESAATVVKGTRATSYWDDALYSACFGYLRGGEEGRIDHRLLHALNNSRHVTEAGPEKVATQYLTNHDHSHLLFEVGAPTTAIEKPEGATGRWYKTQPFVIALFTGTGVPLVSNGSEFGEEHFVPENDNNTKRRILPRPLRWRLAGDLIGAPLLRLYRTMARMRRDHPGLRSPNMQPEGWEAWQTRFDPNGLGLDVERQLMVYRRWTDLPDGGVEEFVVVLNFSGAEQSVTVPFPSDGTWTDLLNDTANPWTVGVHGHALEVPVSSYWGRVFRRD